MKNHLTGFGVSTLLHAGLLALVVPLLWQELTPQPPVAAPIRLSLAQFQLVAAVTPAVSPAPEPMAKPEAAPLSKPVDAQPIANTPKTLQPKSLAPNPQRVAKPKPKEPPKTPKPLEKAKPKVAEKPKAVEPKVKPQAKPERVQPEPQAKSSKRQPAPKPVREAEPQPALEAVEAKPAPTPRPATPKPQTETAAVPQANPPARPIAPPPPRPVPPLAKAPAAAPVVDNRAVEATYRRRMQSLIDARKQYPRLAEKAEIEGSVMIAFTVLANGSISGARVTKSSGNQWLDNGALQAVMSASGILPLPPELHKNQLPLVIVLNYQLE